MRTLGLLLVAVLLLTHAARAQESDAPDGAIVDAVEMSGLSPYDLSPGLRQDLDALVGAPLNRERLNALASRIESERPEVVVAIRSLSRPEGKAHVVVLAAQISDDTGLVDNINARYRVESVALSGVPDATVSQQLRDDLQALVGDRLDTGKADALRTRLETELPNRAVKRRISRGSQPGLIHVVFEVGDVELPLWIPFAPSRSKLVYHSTLGWSGVVDLPMGGRANRLTLGFVFDDGDDLIEEYSGFRARFESRKLGTDRLGASIEISSLRESWEDTTLTALALETRLPEAYRSRVSVEPLVTVAFNPVVRVTAGVSISELESLSASPASQMANAFVAGIGLDQRWEGAGRSFEQRVEAGYELRAARGALASDLSYTRSFGQARYQYTRNHSTIVGSAAFGYINGDAPLFERFSLGDSSTLRGWNKFDVAPAGGDRMFHQSIEFRFFGAALFLDAGSVWDPDRDRTTRFSTGFGYHGDNWFLTVGFPLNTDEVNATFLAGVRF